MPKSRNHSKQECCCALKGQGWGDPCELCPEEADGALLTRLPYCHENLSELKEDSDSYKKELRKIILWRCLTIVICKVEATAASKNIFLALSSLRSIPCLLVGLLV